MNRDDRYDELLWELSRLSGSPARRGESQGASRDLDLDEETLRAWRDGRLQEAEAEAVEARLASSSEARARLAALAAVEPEAPPPALRHRVLERFGTRPSQGLVRWWKPVVGLAASLLVAVGIGYLLLGRGPSPLPAELAFDLAASGLAEHRGEAPPVAGGAIQAYAETRVRLEVTPRAAGAAGLDFGLYRVRGGHLERLAPPGAVDARVELRVERGAATLSAQAVELVGPEPGRSTLYVVVARQGDLPPPVVEVSGEEPEALLAAAGRRLVYSQSITLLPTPAGDLPPEGRDERR